LRKRDCSWKGAQRRGNPLVIERQGLQVSCPEEIAFAQQWIDAAQIQKLATPLAKNGYGRYLLSLLK